ncbi:MAG: hypothetical protein ACRD29_03015 [Acidimicrobiales bacterium]
MPTYVLRVWLPDRPGALGSVASRVGAVRGDVIGIDILERDGGRAIDELVIDLPDDALVPLLLAEVRCVEGVDIEDVRPVDPDRGDWRLDALETAVLLVMESTPGGLLVALTTAVVREFQAEWSAVVDVDGPSEVARAGRPPPVAWVVAFVEGSRASPHTRDEAAAPNDIAWASLPETDVALVVGRDGRPFHARERRQIAALARIADHRWLDLEALNRRDSGAFSIHRPVSAARARSTSSAVL